MREIFIDLRVDELAQMRINLMREPFALEVEGKPQTSRSKELRSIHPGRFGRRIKPLEDLIRE